LGNLERLGKHPDIELFIYPKEGNTLDEIFSVIKVPNRKEINVRLIGISSDETNSELRAYYKTTHPKKFERFLINREERETIRKSFVEAFKSTEVFKSLKQHMVNNNFVVKNISYEKLFYGNSGGIINIPDTNIVFVKIKPNKAIK
tara:strand:+ start:76 stop:513 length:438 start_codon:yes stop_codon:yes gene_type:complete